MARQNNVWRALDRARRNAPTMPIDVGSARFVIFSDQHKGMRDGADDFQRAERAYNAALEYYFAAGYTLLALGDVEELWECRAPDVIAAYGRTLELEAAFHHEGRYVRFFGNHDDQWESAASVTRHLGPIFPNLEVQEGLRLVLAGPGVASAEIFLVHGHQGSSTDRIRWIGKPVVRYIWRPIQRLTGWRLNSPATSFKLRGETNRAMYEWAKQRGDVVLIAGHTHKPVFLPALRRAELEQELAGLEPLAAAGPPCYFNSGCCCFDDGDCTGIEIADGEIKLVRWPGDDGRPQKKVIRSAPLADVLPAARRSSESSQGDRP